MSTLFPHDLPHPPDIDAQAEADERLWQHYCAVAQRLDVGALITAVCEQLRGEPGETPLSALLEDWKALPQWDWQHPLITPMQAERVGRYVAGVAAAVVEQAIAQALAREDSSC
jgi:hypothetical protein